MSFSMARMPFSKNFCSGGDLSAYSFFEFLYLVSPYPLVVDFWKSQVSGLRDLFVLNQKATTDAPDTYSA